MGHQCPPTVAGEGSLRQATSGPGAAPAVEHRGDPVAQGEHREGGEVQPGHHLLSPVEVNILLTGAFGARGVF